MKKEKKHYKVYYVGTGEGCYSENYQNTYLGEAWAVSEKQACNFVRYRMRDKKYPHGGYAKEVLGDYADEGFVEFRYKAIEIN